ncbi:phage tail protein [Limimaricola pyoseonensis]|uniref:Putative phage tail protein n=1 Tax=Limimaricola pyoseonensis TaxID=521013 RepID=A0A1G7GP47_9RHOB|nr:phage tail protein [Limimaricola pyoseonensis]SDE89958.1 Putative phage tail protein [Limimaricola pyoseonensis]
MTFLLLLVAFVVTASPAAADPISSAIITHFAIKSAVTAFAVRALVQVGVTALVSAVVRQRQRNDAGRSPGIRTQVTTQGGVTPQTTALGYTATAGNLVCPHYAHGVAGDFANAYRTTIIDLGDMPITALKAIWVNGRKCRYPEDFTGGDHADYGKKISHPDFNGRMWVKFYPGTQEVADPYLLSKYGTHPERPWSSDMIGRSVPYVIITLRADPDVWQGDPEFRFEIEGIRLYDLRQDSTAGGSGTQRWSDITTWAYSANPVVQVYNLMRGLRIHGGARFGLGASAADLPYANWAAAMDKCDATVGGEAQYRAGLEISMATGERGGDLPLDAIDDLLSACDGEVVDAGGQWRIRVGAPDLPAAFITDADLIADEPVESSPFDTVDETYNAVRITHPDPAAGWEPTEAPLRVNAAAEARDGQRLVGALDLRAVWRDSQAQRQGIAWVEDAQRMVRHVLTLPPRFSYLMSLETLQWQSDEHGYVSKLFEVTDRALDPESLCIKLSIRERDPNDHAVPVDYLIPKTAPSQVVVPISKQPLPGLQAEGIVIEDASGLSRRAGIRLSWPVALAQGISAIRWQVRVKATLAPVPGGTFSDVAEGKLRFSDGLVGSQTYEVRAKGLRQDTDWSGWITVTTPEVHIQEVDLAPTLNDKIAKGQEVLDKHDALVLGFTGDLATRFGAVQSDIDANVASINGVRDIAYETRSISASISEGMSVLRDPFFTEDGWTLRRWGSGGVLTKIDNEAEGATEKYRVGQTLEFNVTSTQNDGFEFGSDLSIWNGATNAATYVVEVEFTLISGVLGDSAVRIDWETVQSADVHLVYAKLADHLQTPLKIGVPNVARMVLRRPAGAEGQTFLRHDGYLFVNWNGGGLTAHSKHLKIHRLAVKAQDVVTETDVQASVSGYAYAKATTDERIAAKGFELISQMSGGRVAVKGDFEDGSVGEWSGAAAVIANASGVPNGATKALRSMARDAYEGDMRPGDISGRRYRIKGYVYTDGSTVPARIGFHIHRLSGESRWHTEQALGADVTGWQSFDVEVTISTADCKSWRPFIQNLGTDGTDYMRSYWCGLEFYDITDKTEIKATLSQDYLTSAGTNDLITAAKDELRGEIVAADDKAVAMSEDPALDLGPETLTNATSPAEVFAAMTETAGQLEFVSGTDPDVGGKDLIATGYRAVRTRRRWAVNRNRRYRLTVRIKLNAAAQAGNLYLGITCYDANGNSASWNPAYAGGASVNPNHYFVYGGGASSLPVDQWVERTAEFDGSQIRQDAAFMRPLIFANYSGDNSQVTRVSMVLLEDITDAHARSTQLQGEVDELKGLDLDALAGTALATFATSARAAVKRGDGVFKSQYFGDGAIWWSTSPTTIDYLEEDPDTGLPERKVLQWNISAASSAGVYYLSNQEHWVGPKDCEAFHIEIEFELLSGSLDGAGARFDFENTTGGQFVTTARLDEMIPQSEGSSGSGRRTASAVLRKPSNFSGTFSHMQAWFFVNYDGNGLGPKAAKNIKLYRMTVRPASAAEAEVVAQGTVLADMQGNASASYVIKARTGGASAGWEIVAWDDQTGQGTAIVADADDLIAKGSVSARHLAVTDSGRVFNGTFASEDEWADWIINSGDASAASVITDSGSKSGGQSLAVGNNSGNDEIWAYHGTKIPFDPDALYRIEVRFVRTAGSGACYFGIAGFDRFGNLCNTSGANTLSSSHYVAASGVTPALNVWTTYVGYFKGHGVIATNAWDPSDPSGLNVNVRAFAPMFIVNYADLPGVVQIDYIKIDKMADETTISPEGVDTPHLKSRAVTTEKLEVGVGANKIINSDLAMDDLGWFYSGTGTIWSQREYMGLRNGSWAGFDYPTYELSTTGAATSNGYLEMQLVPPNINAGPKQGYSIDPDAYYEFSVQLSHHRVKSELLLVYYNSVGTQVGAHTYLIGAGDQSISSNPDVWTRYGFVRRPGDVNANAAFVRPFVRIYETTGSARDYLFIHKPFLAETTGPNAPLSKWSPGPQTVIGENGILTDAVTARHVRARSMTANEIDTDTLTLDLFANGVLQVPLYPLHVDWITTSDNDFAPSMNGLAQVIVIGGGGGGGACADTNDISLACGGGAGGTVIGFIPNISTAHRYKAIIGGGGAGAYNFSSSGTSGVKGTDGGNSLFQNHGVSFHAYGGKGGLADASNRNTVVGGEGGAGSGGLYNYTGGKGGNVAIPSGDRHGASGGGACQFALGGVVNAGSVTAWQQFSHLDGGRCIPNWFPTGTEVTGFPLHGYDTFEGGDGFATAGNSLVAAQNGARGCGGGGAVKGGGGSGDARGGAGGHGLIAVIYYGAGNLK